MNNNKKLQKILKKHSKWLNEEDGGERADLSYASLSGADLRGANLLDADLHYADLRGANLRGADLRDANLFGANLAGADLRWADLNDVDFCYSDLRGADLSYANLRGAKLSGADLRNAIYTDTILNLQCPDEGTFIAWKKLAGSKIAKLLIPEDAKRSSATTRKCRASKAKVLAIYNRNGGEISEGKSIHDDEFIYRVGETVYPDHWDEDRWNECSNGIHFFITRKEAEEY